MSDVVICPADGSEVERGALCPECQVEAGDDCAGCGEAMYHLNECPLLDELPDETPYLERGWVRGS